MADDSPHPKKVVKRVVKKPTTTGSDQPTLRYGRSAPKSAVTPVGTKPPARPAPTVTEKKPRQAKIKVRSAVTAIKEAGGSAASGVVRGARRSADGVASGARSVAAIRLPQLEPRRAAIVTGLVAGLIAVGLGALAKVVFSHVRGVSSGGGTWGSLTFLVVTFIAFLIGERLLSAFGLKHSLVTSLLGAVLTITAILGIFIELSDSKWAFILVPVLGAIAFGVSQWLLDQADRAAVPTD